MSEQTPEEICENMLVDLFTAGVLLDFQKYVENRKYNSAYAILKRIGMPSEEVNSFIREYAINLGHDENAIIIENSITESV